MLTQHREESHQHVSQGDVKEDDLAPLHGQATLPHQEFVQGQDVSNKCYVEQIWVNVVDNINMISY